MQDYNDKVKDHFTNPRNVGEIDDADSVAEIANPACGDTVKVWVKLSDDKKTIVDVKFKALGCAACVATASMMTEMAKGKSVEDAKKINDREVAEALGGLPAPKMTCSNFAAGVLAKALESL